MTLWKIMKGEEDSNWGFTENDLHAMNIGIPYT